jgi:phosphate transport system permease protein
VISTQVPGMPLSQQYGTALVLLLIVLSLTLIASLVRSIMRQRREW